MVGTYKEYSWLQIKLTSTSLKDVKLVMLDLFVNPEYSKFIEKVEAIHLLADSSVVLRLRHRGPNKHAERRTPVLRVAKTPTLGQRYPENEDFVLV